MAKKRYEFKTGVVDVTSLAGVSSASYSNYVSRTGAAGAAYTYPTGEATYANVKAALDTTYAPDVNLNGKVMARIVS